MLSFIFLINPIYAKIQTKNYLHEDMKQSMNAIKENKVACNLDVKIKSMRHAYSPARMYCVITLGNILKTVWIGRD